MKVKALSDLSASERRHCRYITNARLPGFEGRYAVALSRYGTLLARSPHNSEAASDDLQAMECEATDTHPCIDLNGDWLSPGGVDIQINGALGLAFPDLEDCHHDTLLQICRYLGSQGIDGFCPTLVTTAIANIHRALAVIAAVQDELEQKQDLGVARIWGVHLEGPCLNAEKRGAHPQAHLQPLTLDVMKQVLGEYSDRVRVITLAPELDQRAEVIPYLRALGIVVSLGHSQATAEQAKAAFDQGATLVTHAFNAMPSLHHRKPGLLGAALTYAQVHCGVIADGQHVCPTMLDLLMRIGRGSGKSCQPTAMPAYPQGLFLVSDALAPLGLPDGTYPWDTRQIYVNHGTARLDDGTLAGTTHPLLVGVQNLVKWGVCDVGEAIALATLAPRQALGLSPFPVAAQTSQWLRWSLEPSTQALHWTPI